MIEEYGLCRLDPNCDVGYYAGMLFSCNVWYQYMAL